MIDRPRNGCGKIGVESSWQSIDMVEESPESVVPAAKAKSAGKKAKPAATEASSPATDTPISDTAAASVVAIPPSEEKSVPPKKEKPPAVEAKPFVEFVEQDYLPALTQALVEKGITDLHLALEQAKIAVKGFETSPACSQVIGRWADGKRQFNIYFFEDNIQGKRAISCVDRASKSSTIESFLIDERKITLDLLVSGLVLRLNSQKWLLRN